MEKKIIVAEDSITIQKVFELSFLRSPYRVTYVEKGSEVLPLAEELKPDLIICDLSLPDMSGFDVVSQLKNNPVTKEIPVLLLAGSLEPLDEEKFRACGADSLLLKPFESQELLDRIEELTADGAGVAEEVPEVDTPQEGWDFTEVFEEVEMGLEGGAEKGPELLDEMVVDGTERAKVEAEEFSVSIDEVEAGEEVREPEGKTEAEERDDLTTLDDILDEVPDEELEELDSLFVPGEGEAGELDVSAESLGLEEGETPSGEGDRGEMEVPVSAGEAPPREEGETEAPPEEEEEILPGEEIIVQEQVRHVDEFPISSGYEVESKQTIRESLGKDKQPTEAAPTGLESALLSPELTEGLKKSIEETAEKVLWDVIPSLVEEMREEFRAAIREVAADVVPKVAERIISEEVRKIREEISSGD